MKISNNPKQRYSPLGKINLFLGFLNLKGFKRNKGLSG